MSDDDEQLRGQVGDVFPCHTALQAVVPRPSTMHNTAKRLREITVTHTNAGPGPEVVVSDGRFVCVWSAADCAGCTDDELRSLWRAYRELAMPPRADDPVPTDEQLHPVEANAYVRSLVDRYLRTVTDMEGHALYGLDPTDPATLDAARDLNQARLGAALAADE